jgi:hypothetical protein
VRRAGLRKMPKQMLHVLAYFHSYTAILAKYHHHHVLTQPLARRVLMQ